MAKGKEEDLEEFLDEDSTGDHPQISSSYETIPRKKKAARIYYGVVAFVMIIFLLLCVVGLGSFGDFQRKISKFYKPGEYGRNRWCILFAHSEPYTDPNDDTVTWKIEYRSFGPCVFMLWALVSGSIFAFVLLVYYIVLCILGPRVLNFLRILDFILFTIGFLAFLSFAITLTAGLSQTCYGPVAGQGHSCGNAVLRNQDKDELYFYNAVATARNCSWIITMLLLCFSVWNLILMVMFVRQLRKKSRVERNEDMLQ